MKHPIAAFTLASVMAAALPLGNALAAVELKGVRFDDTIQVGDQPLQLNGAGVRVKVIVDVYAASLYLPHKGNTVEDALGQPGAKSVHAVLLRDVTARDFVGALIKGFKANNSPEQYQRYLPRLQELSRLMEEVGSAHKGTVVRLDYLPQVGTRIYVDGKRQGADLPGEEFYQGLLRIWLGPKPVDNSLKAALLGRQ
ncbi:MAG TPA: chalcone isomerase family protein [Candidatus Aquabacterium excrementipullorum]|nr:chalcone isomerase family protein [Candidatus Aquabacterium excrementipullorum]